MNYGLLAIWPSEDCCVKFFLDSEWAMVFMIHWDFEKLRDL